MRRRAARLMYGSADKAGPETDPYLASVPVCRVQLVRETSRVYRSTIDSAEDAAKTIADYLARVDREHFVVLMLDAKNHLLGIHTVSIGTLTSAQVAAREVFKAAVLANAASVIVGHNHPSGDPTPSPEDIDVTDKLVAAGTLLDIVVIDHVVVGERGSYVSIRRGGGTCSARRHPHVTP